MQILIFSICTYLSAQDYETILWEPHLKLTWEDFKGEVPQPARAAAITASGISYRFSTMEGDGELEIRYKVSTFFYPNKSWFQPALENEVILSHEQLHFDISELYARKMRKLMATTKFTRNVKAEVKAIYKKINEELAEFQDLYDTETNFSRNVEEQLRWNRKIKEALGN